jgi:hypothetical protein
MARERDLPPLVDFGDSIDGIAQSTDRDVEDDIEALREDLDRLEDRDDVQTREGILDNIDNTLRSLRGTLDEDGEADQYAEGIQNRIQQYRANRDADSGTFSIDQAGIEVDGVEVDVNRHRGETAALAGRIVNAGTDADAATILTFYDERGRVCRTVEHHERDLGTDEQRDLEVPVYLPTAASYYAVRTVAAADSRSLAGEEPVPEAVDREERPGRTAADPDEADLDEEDDGERPASERSAEEITDGR